MGSAENQNHETFSPRRAMSPARHPRSRIVIFTVFTVACVGLALFYLVHKGRRLEYVRSENRQESSDSVSPRSGEGKTEEVTSFQGHTAWVSSVAFSPDGKRAVSGSSDNTARLWDIESG